MNVDIPSNQNDMMIHPHDKVSTESNMIVSGDTPVINSKVDVTNSDKKPTKLKKTRRRKKKTSHQDMMNQITKPQSTDTEKREIHLAKISKTTGHGCFNKLDRI